MKHIKEFTHREFFFKNFFVYYAVISFIVSGCSTKNTLEKKELVVELGKTITLDYAAGFDNGTLFDTTIEIAAKKAGIYDPNRIYEPVKIVYGKDPLFLGLQEMIFGMKEGETKNFRVPPQKAYGIRVENSTIVLPKAMINNYKNLRINDIITILSNDKKINAYIKDIGEENAVVDLNHPLAGHYVQFAVIVRKIE